jgi:lipoate-protein ligase A
VLCIDLPSTDPFFNLAVDEHLLKNRSEEFFVLGANTPSVIIGKHQVAHRESYTRFVSQNGIPVIRRISGGGTVFHDMGNLNFSFILQSTQGRQVDFRKYTLPVINFLKSKGIDAKFEGKNDLKVNGFKISGNAEHVHHERVLHHGTLLFSSDLGRLRGSLRKDKSCYSTRAVESNPSSVANLCDLLPGQMFEEFRSEMFLYFLDQTGNTQVKLVEEEIFEIESLAATKYRTWDWNYGYGPEYLFNNSFDISGSQYTCSMFVKNGKIEECRLEGSGELTASGEKLTGCRHHPSDLERVFAGHGRSVSEEDIFKFF